MSLLSPPHLALDLGSPGTTTNTTRILSHSFAFATLLHRLLSTTTLYITFRTYLFSLLLLNQIIHAAKILLINTLHTSRTLFLTSLYTSRILLLNSFSVSRLLLQHSLHTSKFLTAHTKMGVQGSWKAIEPLRNKIFHEFMVFILGGGNVFILMLFWPGWLVLGGAAGGAWLVCG